MSQTRAFEAGLEKLIARHPYLKFDVDWPTGIAIISQLQLALRHPDNKGHSARMARKIIDEIVRRIADVDSKLAELLRMGDGP